MDLKELMKKISSLKDLRAAINEVKSLTKDAKVIPMPIQQKQTPIQSPREQQRTAAQSALEPKGQLKHLGLKETHSGQMTHMIGIPGSNWHYEVTMDMHQSAHGNPAFTVKHVDSGGHTKSQSNKVHSDIGSAVRDLVNHSHSGEWSGK